MVKGLGKGNKLKDELELMVKRLKKEKYDVNVNELWTNLSIVEEFLLN
ncbi:hypothetical protein WAX74_20090 [Psychrobacillus sp. FJAT-51614]|uniref:Uncharacterized protein n=1 Tax=Psychrobacillus mangrovi TaxID=3117745 RepID=A0ABU8FA95_9BACI